MSRFVIWTSTPIAEYDSFRIWAICWMITSPVGMTIGSVNPSAALDSRDERLRLLRVVLVRRDVLSPVLHLRHHVVRDLDLVEVDALEHRLLVGRVVQRLPNLDVVERRLGVVEPHSVEAEELLDLDVDVVLSVQLVDLRVRDRDRRVDLAALQLEDAGVVVGDVRDRRPRRDAGGRASSSPDSSTRWTLPALGELLQLEGAGPDRVLRERLGVRPRRPPSARSRRGRR